MPQPSENDFYRDEVLTNVSVKLKPQGFIAEDLIPNVAMSVPSAMFPSYDRGAWFRDEAGARPVGGKARRGGYDIDWDTIKAIDWAFGKEVFDRVREWAVGPAINPELDAVAFTTAKILLKKEVLCAALCTTLANWTGMTNDAEGLWVAADATNTFIADVEAAMELIRKASGMSPNRLAIDAATWSLLKQSAPLLDRVKYTGSNERPAKVTPQAIAELLGLDRVLIGGAIVSTAKEASGGEDWTAADIWRGPNSKGVAWLGYCPPAPSAETPSASYCFQVKGRYIRRYREEAEERDVFECAEIFGHKVTSIPLGYVFYDTFST